MTTTEVLSRVGFGGGCHWCTEAVFQTLDGVMEVQQGWIASRPPEDHFSEAVQLQYQPHDISLAVLIEIHLRTHASTSQHKFRHKYRSAVYVYDEASHQQARASLEQLQAEFDQPLVTRVLPAEKFKQSPPEFQNYYATDPQRPFCKTYIDPKLQLLRDRFSKQMKADEA